MLESHDDITVSVGSARVPLAMYAKEKGHMA